MFYWSYIIIIKTLLVEQGTWNMSCNMSTKCIILISLHRLDDLTEVIKGAFLSI